MTRKLECRHCGTYNSAGDVCRCRTVDPTDEKEKFILAIETEITKAVNCLETGNEYEGILSLKGIQLAFRLRRECT
jgi:hypothetical protein